MNLIFQPFNLGFSPGVGRGSIAGVFLVFAKIKLGRNFAFPQFITVIFVQFVFLHQLIKLINQSFNFGDINLMHLPDQILRFILDPGVGRGSIAGVFLVFAKIKLGRNFAFPQFITVIFVQFVFLYQFV